MNSIYKIGLSKKFLLVAFPFLIGLVIFLTLRSFSHEAEVVKVKVGSIRNSVTGNVQILAEQTFELITEAQGKVVEVALLPFGKPVEVKEGDVLFELDSSDLNRSLRRVLLGRDSLTKKLKLGSSLAAQLEIERKDLNATREIYNKDGIADLDFEKKVLYLNNLERSVEIEKITNSEALDSYEIEEERLIYELNKRKIKSPITGLLVNSMIKPGDRIFPGQVVGKVLSHERVVKVSLNEDDFNGLNEGQKVGVTLFAYGQHIFEGKIDRLSATIDPTTGRREVFVTLDTAENLPVGASGRAEIIKNEIKQAVIAPRKALLGDSVLVVKNGKVDFVKVRVGARNLEKVEILDGLKAGLQVISETLTYFTRARESAQYCLLGKLLINREPAYFGIGPSICFGSKAFHVYEFIGYYLWHRFLCRNPGPNLRL